MIKKILSCLGGYFDNRSFKLDLPKVAEIAEVSEEEVLTELNKLKESKDIEFNNDTITLLTIEPKTSRKFNSLYAPTETFIWNKGTKLKLDV